MWTESREQKDYEVFLFAKRFAVVFGETAPTWNSIHGHFEGCRAGSDFGELHSWPACG